MSSASKASRAVLKRKNKNISLSVNQSVSQSVTLSLTPSFIPNNSFINCKGIERRINIEKLQQKKNLVNN